MDAERRPVALVMDVEVGSQEIEGLVRGFSPVSMISKRGKRNDGFLVRISVQMCLKLSVLLKK